MIISCSIAVIVTACGGSDRTSTGANDSGPRNGPEDVSPRGGETGSEGKPAENSTPTITVSPIDPTPITAVSKFRSCSGHDFSPGVRGRGGPDTERARSMKNYLQTDLTLDAVGEVEIRAPFDGQIEIRSEQFDLGKQVYIHADGWALRLFHIDPSVEDGAEVKAGDKVGSIVPANAQEMLGRQLGPDGKPNPYQFDIAVTNRDDTEFRSMFDLMDDNVAAEWAARGFTKENTTISREERDASPCEMAPDGERFAEQDNGADDWVQAS